MEEPESIEIRTRDGQALGAELREPFRRRIQGTCIFVHPMYANKSTFARPRGRGVVELFVAAGFRTLAFDLRGHGESKPREPREHPWGYDDFVQIDLPAVVEAARTRWPRARVTVVGHSLGGQVALAAQGAGFIHADALISVGSNPWMRRFEPSRLVWSAKLASLVGFGALTRTQGYFPARALGLGSDDEAAPFVEDFCRFALTDEWRSADGRLDYAALLSTIDVPVLAVTSAGDRFVARTAAITRMMAGVRSCQHFVLERDGKGAAPGHMEMLTQPGTHDGWTRAIGWLERVLGTK